MKAPLLSILCSLFLVTGVRSSRAEASTALPYRPLVERLSRAQILERVAQTVKPATVVKYGGNFEAYWADLGASKSGKFAEAYVALKYNRSSAATAGGDILEPTALINPADPFDLELRNSSGQLLKRFQLKLGRDAAINAISDPKYARGIILTPSDTLEAIRTELRKRLETAARRGIELPPKWQAVEDALLRGRLTDEIREGWTIGIRSRIESVAREFLRHIFDPLAQKLGVAPASATRLVTRAGPLIRFGGKAVAIGGASISLYKGIDDYQRWSAGQVDGGELAIRWTIRGSFAAGAVYAVLYASGPVGWTIDGVIIVGTYGLDYYDAEQDRQFQRILAGIEFEDRFAEVRQLLLTDFYPSVTSAK